MLTVNYVWTCDYCGETKVKRQQELRVGFQVEHSDLPYRWNSINGMLVCPNHVTRVTDLETPDA